MLNKRLPLVSSALIFLYSATLLASGKSYSYIAISFCIISLLILPITLKNKLPTDFYKISIALTGYFLITALSLLLMGGKLSNLDMPSRTVFILPAFVFLLNFPPKKEWVFSGILIGSLMCGLIALYHTQILNIRAFFSFDYMVIQSGNMAMSLGLFSLIIAIQYIKEKKIGLSSLATICALAGIFASLLSGARGGWVLAPFILISLLILNRQILSKKVIIILTVTLISGSFLTYNIAENRVQKVVTDITQLSQKHNANTSTGARIEMWKSGIYNFIDHPLFGTGYQERQKYNQILVDNNLVDPIVLNFGRLHNSYIEELSIKGIIGFTALMLFFYFPLYLFLSRGNIKNNVFSQLGVVHIALVMSYCLSQNYINHHSGMLHYLMYTIIFYAMLHHQENSHLSENSKVIS